MRVFRYIHKILRIIQGKYDLWLGICPRCHSHAPLQQACAVCEAFDSRNDGKPDLELKSGWWEKFKRLEYRSTWSMLGKLPRNMTEVEKRFNRNNIRFPEDCQAYNDRFEKPMNSDLREEIASALSKSAKSDLSNNYRRG